MTRRFIMIALLAVSAFASAIAVVYSKHLSRKYFVGLQELQLVRDDLNIEWGRLQLEQSTLADHGRIDRLGRERLDMQLPSAEAIVIVKP